MSLLRATNLHKTYTLGRVKVPVLRGLDFKAAQREFVAVLGASGSGKSTLLHLLGGLDRPDKSKNRASITFRDSDITRASSRELDRYRARSVGFVFQSYHLLPELNVLENVLIAAMVRHGRVGYSTNRAEIRERAESLLNTFGLGERLKHRPRELSGGERQRVAIARSLINQPSLLLADEPTGNLDQKTGHAILDCVDEVRAKQDLTVIMVTHDHELAARAGRIVELVDGRVADSTPAEA